MKCHTIRPRLSAYQDGELPTQTQHRIAEHLASCPACAKIYQDKQRLLQTLQHAQAVVVPETLTAQIMRRALALRPRPSLVPFLASARQKIAYALLFILVFAFGFWAVAGAGKKSLPEPATDTIELASMLSSSHALNLIAVQEQTMSTLAVDISHEK